MIHPRAWALAQLAMLVASALHSGTGTDPFVKVKGQIADMIEWLENVADATEKVFCDKELSETKTRNKPERTNFLEKRMLPSKQQRHTWGKNSPVWN